MVTKQGAYSLLIDATYFSYYWHGYSYETTNYFY